MAKKRGKLSTEECNYITRNVHEMTVAEIAANMNRTETTVKKYIIENNLVGPIESEHLTESDRLMSVLKGKPYYESALDQLTSRELRRYELHWLYIMSQFQEDVLYTEELGIHEWGLLLVLKDRAMVDQKFVQEEIEQLLDRVSAERAKEDRTDDENAHLTNLEGQLAMARSNKNSAGKELKEIGDQIDRIKKGMNAHRAARIKRIEDGKKTWSGYLKDLEDERERQKHSRKAELLRMAKDKVKLELSELHTYEDGNVDRPFLTPELVAMHEGKDKK